MIGDQWRCHREHTAMTECPHARRGLMANFACPPAPMTTLSLNEVPPPHRVETGASEEATRWGFPRCRSPPGPPGTGTPENSPANWPAIHSRHSSTPFGGRARGRPQVPPHSTRWKKYAGGWKNLPCIETPSPGASRRRRRDGAPARPNRPPRAVPYPRPACPVNDPKTRRECHPGDPERRRCKSSPDSPRPPRCQTRRRTNARQRPTPAPALRNRSPQKIRVLGVRAPHRLVINTHELRQVALLVVVDRYERSSCALRSSSRRSSPPPSQ